MYNQEKLYLQKTFCVFSETDQKKLKKPYCIISTSKLYCNQDEGKSRKVKLFHGKV